ncbi:DUF1963 domain-containing protein [Leptospira ellisii]|uniref:DUF1963 domain-containing protein n=1 Tax=Leptospira ellisii TaxID=2023197 RepID=A0A2N0BPP1_9LEPT|nr:DUF1963 domain-containing protein [Leptospira ellisii]MDV6236357.1 DUF1963 domain-containing protein [Leptospira ellisii]PJZ93300.1 hypothetical protein CH379_08640 [Leptospira ellisii]PKA05915.1 hypothetical protein CH375_02520 [Leptospira ellisii]
MSNPILNAKRLVREFPFPADLLSQIPTEGTYYDGSSSVYFEEDDAVTPELLSKTLHYYIDIDETESEEEEIPLGASKMKGLPHLPDSIVWPEGTYFFAQLNLEEFKRFDVENVFPDKGILYVFDTVQGEFVLRFYEGPISDLKRVPYPDEEDLPEAEYYLEEYRDTTYRLSFEPKFLFYVAGDAYDYRKVAGILPKNLIEQLSDILKAELTTWHSSLRIFGRPLFWQGEDERMGGDDEEDAEERDLLLFHSEIGEGHFHIWIDRNDLKQKKFDKAYSSYSGT